MSGGHFNYGGSLMRDHLEMVSQDGAVKRRWPLTAAILAGLADLFYEAEQAIDYDLSGDSSVGDDVAFDITTVSQILVLVMKNAPDKWFPRGKWATIQAVEGRVDAKETDTE